MGRNERPAAPLLRAMAAGPPALRDSIPRSTRRAAAAAVPRRARAAHCDLFLRATRRTPQWRGEGDPSPGCATGSAVCSTRDPASAGRPRTGGAPPAAGRCLARPAGSREAPFGGEKGEHAPEGRKIQDGRRTGGCLWFHRGGGDDQGDAAAATPGNPVNTANAAEAARAARAGAASASEARPANRLQTPIGSRGWGGCGAAG